MLALLGALPGCLAEDAPATRRDLAPEAPDMASAVRPGPGYRMGLPPLIDATVPSGLVPTLLSQTGLYASTAQKTLAPGVEAFAPTYTLWSDGADKYRYLRLPDDTSLKIDNADMNRWRYPVGIKLWKEFRKDGKRIETRLLWKRAEPSPNDVGWEMQTYVWKDDESDAVLTTTGVVGARGTDHDVPRQIDCNRCHRIEFEAPIGFAALQLSGDGTGVRLRDLVSRGRLTTAVAAPDSFAPPGDAATKAALGYLHANCGGCHAPDSLVFPDVNMSLRLEIGKLASLQTTPTYLTTVNQMTTSVKAGARGRVRVKPGEPSNSEIWVRMGIRMVGPESLMMPPLGSHTVDATSRQLIANWIMSLP